MSYPPEHPDLHVRTAPAWLYVQDAGEGTVSFVGASRMPDGGAHPFRYGSERTHQFVLGGVSLSAHTVIGTEAYRGHGLSGLATNYHDLEQMLASGEYVIRKA